MCKPFSATTGSLQVGHHAAEQRRLAGHTRSQAGWKGVHRVGFECMDGWMFNLFSLQLENGCLRAGLFHMLFFPVYSWDHFGVAHHCALQRFGDPELFCGPFAFHGQLLGLGSTPKALPGKVAEIHCQDSRCSRVLVGMGLDLTNDRRVASRPNLLPAFSYPKFYHL